MNSEIQKVDRAPVKLLQTFYQAVADDLEMLMLLQDREPDWGILEGMRDCNFPKEMGLKLVSEEGTTAIELMVQAVNSIPETPESAYLDELAADYADIYLNHSLQASPQESVWIDEESLTCQESMFQVRAWYELHGLAAENWRVRSDDHLVLQLQFLSHLFANAESENELTTAARFMDEHLLRWLGEFSLRVANRCGTAYFAGVVLLTAAYCEELRELMAKVLDQPRPSPEEIEERMQPKASQVEVPLAYMPGMGPAV
ncbi:MAG: molecular chaperone TorD family protein [Candidatus Thiodiazotropha sp. (ex Monitilora ramsayi)]|nr:molecular chaperone TorD family protein [Candidatus Thiodiazotropha sp. (ex Monitilora ramsayi)]